MKTTTTTICRRPKAKAETTAKKKPAKPLAIDPKLLERALQYRNANRGNAGN